MSHLPDDATLDDLESEQIVYKVLLETLDPRDVVTRRKYVQVLRELYQRLARKRRAISNGQTSPSDAIRTGPDRSASQSCSQPSVPDWKNNDSSPSYRQSGASSSALGKRPLSIDAGCPNGKDKGKNKIRRVDDSDTASPPSDDSNDDLGIPSIIAGSGEWGSAYRMKMEAKQREAEERWKRQREDEAFARDLHEQGTLGQASASAGPSDELLQATLARNGTFELSSERCQRDAHVSEPTRTLSTHASLPSDLTSLEPSNFNGRSALNRSQPVPGRQLVPGGWDSSTDSDDSLELMSWNSFLPSTSLGGSRSSITGRPPFNASINRHMQSYTELANGVPSELTALGLAADIGGGRAIPPSYVSRAREDSMFESEREWAARYMENMRQKQLRILENDQIQNREELVKLLETIRPDEDLPPEMRSGSPIDLNVRLMEHQKLGLAWLTKQEEGSNKGGILADDMGLGKTIQALALILARRSTDPAVKTTLIVAPVSLMRQWQREIEEKVVPARPLKVYIYHGTGVKVSFAKLAKMDVVMTTYGTLAAEWNRKIAFERERAINPDAPCRHNLTLMGEGSRFHRVILDEAQCIKNKTAKASLAAASLKTTYRLCMTGTPMMNNLLELYPLIRFLNIGPYNHFPTFSSTFVNAMKGIESARQRSMQKMQVLLKAVMLRRTKESKIDGKPILELPPKVVAVKHAVFDTEQQSFYDALEANSQLQFNKYLRAGTVGRNYSNVLLLLLRLRQCCDHPHLIKDYAISIDGQLDSEGMEELANRLEASVVERIKATGGGFECPICYDAASNPTIFFPCGHDVCPECFTRMIDPSNAVARGEDGATGGSAKCPECRQTLDVKKIIDYNTFLKVHDFDKYRETVDPNARDVRAEEQETDDEDEETESESDDSDSQGDLDNFIVPDNVVEYAEQQDGAGRGDTETTSKQHRVGKSDRDETQQKRKKKLSKKAKGKKKMSGKRTKKLAELKKDGMRNKAAKKKYSKRLQRDWVSSAKIEKMMEILEEIRTNDPTEKTIIFSQFTSFLDMCEIPIVEKGMNYTRYDGSMKPAERNDAVEEFSDSRKGVNVMLVSLKAGNAGLNLTKASQVIMLDPFWNPYVEEQAIDRAHRLGQTKPVHVHRLLVSNTVEDRILAMQERKRELINQALDENSARSLGRLGVRELGYLFGVHEQPTDSN